MAAILNIVYNHKTQFLMRMGDDGDNNLYGLLDLDLDLEKCIEGDADTSQFPKLYCYESFQDPDTETVVECPLAFTPPASETSGTAETSTPKRKRSPSSSQYESRLEEVEKVSSLLINAFVMIGSVCRGGIDQLHTTSQHINKKAKASKKKQTDNDILRVVDIIGNSTLLTIADVCESLLPTQEHTDWCRKWGIERRSMDLSSMAVANYVDREALKSILN